MSLNLMLHCGGKAVNREEVQAVKAPARTDTYCPIPHDALIQTVEDSLEGMDIPMEVIESSHGLSHDGKRYFGMMEIAPRPKPGQFGVPNGIDGSLCMLGNPPKDYNTVIGLRNSHDKIISAGAACGSGVFVCDNLCFSGEVKLARKHTPNILADLPHLVREMVENVVGTQVPFMNRRIATYREAELSDVEAHDTMIRAVKAGGLIPNRLKGAIQEWDAPRHPEFERDGKTGWRLFNAFTEAMKGSSPHQLVERTMAIHDVMDEAVSLDLTAADLN